MIHKVLRGRTPWQICVDPIAFIPNPVDGRCYADVFIENGLNVMPAPKELSTVIAGISSAQGAVGIESFVPGFIVLSHVTPRAVKIRNDSFAEFIQLFVRDLGFETFFNFWGHSLCCKL